MQTYNIIIWSRKVREYSQYQNVKSWISSLLTVLSRFCFLNVRIITESILGATSLASLVSTSFSVLYLDCRERKRFFSRLFFFAGACQEDLSEQTGQWCLGFCKYCAEAHVHALKVCTRGCVHVQMCVCIFKVQQKEDDQVLAKFCFRSLTGSTVSKTWEVSSLRPILQGQGTVFCLHVRQYNTNCYAIELHQIFHHFLSLPTKNKSQSLKKQCF